MKNYLHVLAIWSICASVSAQPVKLWSNSFGGNQSDVASSIRQYNDTMIVAIGKSSSTNIGMAHGGDDFMLCQFKPSGELIRMKVFGGPQIDQPNAFVKLPSGDILIGGYTTGKGGDVSNLYGLTDIWLLEVDAQTGLKKWEKNFGGTNNDQLNDLFFLEAGRIFMAGHTKSIDKDVSTVPTKGGNDVLIMSINETGAISKAVTFGGTKDETAKRIIKSEEFGGQMLVIGETESNDMDFAGLAKGKKDLFILKINRNINKVFLKTLGGPGDDIFADAIVLPDLSSVIFATVNTSGGQVDSLKGGKDVWAVRIDKDGNILWSRTIGGSRDETAVDAQLTSDGHIILALNSVSNDKDISISPYGGTNDVLLMKLDTMGNILWRKYYGGTSGDNAGAICIDSSDAIYFAASSFSTDFDLTPKNINPPDFWVVKSIECKTYEGTVELKACADDTLVYNKKKYYKGHETGVDTFIKGNYFGCDSILHVNVEFKEPQRISLQDTICFDSTLVIHNVEFNRNHTEDSIFLKDQLGCDSILMVQVDVLNPLEVSDTLIIKDDGTGKGCIGVSIRGGCEPYLYFWDNGPGTSSRCNLKSGYYNLSVTDCRGCAQMFRFFVPSTVGSQDVPQDQILLNFYNLTGRISWGNVKISLLTLYTVSGQQVWSEKPSRDYEIIPENTFEKGVYLLEARDIQGRTGYLLINL